MAFLESDKMIEFESYKTHQLLTWSDTIAVEGLFFGEFLAFCLGSLSNFFGLFRCSEPSTSLLIHLCTRCDSIHRHKEYFLRLYLPEEMIHICEDGGKNLFLRESKMGIFVIGMRACNTSVANMGTKICNASHNYG